MTALRIARFPWERVPRLDLAWVRARRELCDTLDATLDSARLVRGLEELLGDDVRASIELCGAPTSREAKKPGLTLSVRFVGRGLRFDVMPEAELLRAAVARLLEQDFELGWADTDVDPPLAGAGAALLLEAARRAARSEAPELMLSSAPTELAPNDPALEGFYISGRATVWLADKPYGVDVSIRRVPTPERREPKLAPRLSRLGDVRLSVPWVSAVSSVAVAELTRLGIGDVWVPGASAWLGGDTTMDAGMLVPPGVDRGLPVRVSGGRIVLGAGAVRMPEELESKVSQEDSELEQIVGETQLVVRLEVGALEMTAAEWAALRPGDVVQSGRRLEDPVILRAGGREIARGELVDIDGEVGVRITRVGLAKAT